MTDTTATEPLWLRLVDEIHSPVAPPDRRDLLWMTPDDVWSLGLSSGELRVVAAAKHLQALDDDWPRVDHTWRCRIADALDDMSTRIRRHPS